MSITCGHEIVIDELVQKAKELNDENKRLKAQLAEALEKLEALE